MSWCDKNDRDEFTLRRSQITTDPHFGARLDEIFRAKQAAQDRYLAEQEALRLKEERQQIEYLQAHPLGTPRPTPP